MTIRLRIATFNLENLDDRPEIVPTLAERVALLRPQLHRIDADILCLQEVHSQPVGATRRLLALESLLAATPYATFSAVSTTADGIQPMAERNLVVLSRFPIVTFRQINQSLVQPPLYRPVTAVPLQLTAQAITWDRPILYAEIALPHGERLHVVNVHLKSKIPVPIPGQVEAIPDTTRPRWLSASGQAEGAFLSAIKRIGQALETRRLIDAVFDETPEALIAVCGDFNADAEEVSLLAIRGDVESTDNPTLARRVMVLCERSVAESGRFSLLHHGRGEMIDHILASRELFAHYRTTEIHNETLHDETLAFAVDQKFAESDHAPVIAVFELREE